MDEKSKVQIIADFITGVLKSPKKLFSLIGLLMVTTVCVYFLFAFKGCTCNGKTIQSDPIKIKKDIQAPQ